MRDGHELASDEILEDDGMPLDVKDGVVGAREWNIWWSLLALASPHAEGFCVSGVDIGEGRLPWAPYQTFVYTW